MSHSGLEQSSIAPPKSKQPHVSLTSELWAKGVFKKLPVNNENLRVVLSGPLLVYLSSNRPQMTEWLQGAVASHEP
jgi:hypothetical protein